MPTENEFEVLRLLYQENSAIFRYFCTWRRFLLAGYFVILAALALGFRWAYFEAEQLKFVFPAAGALVSFTFLGLDSRNRQLFQQSGEMGHDLEEQLGFKELGYFGAYVRGRGWLSLSLILACLYISCGLIMLLLAVLLGAGCL